MSKILIKNVRISYPSLFTRSVYKGKEGKYDATFIIPKQDTETINTISREMQAIATAKNLPLKSIANCMSNGDESNDESYADTYTLKAGNNVRPTVIARDRSPITDADGIIYAGCYVNAIVSFYFTNQWGNRISANLLGVQFVSDGDPLGATRVAPSEDFEKLDDEKYVDPKDGYTNYKDDGLDEYDVPF